MKSELLEPRHSLLRFPSFRSVQTSIGARNVARNLGIGGLLSLLLVSLAPWQQTADGLGRVVALDPSERQQSIDAPIEGRLAKWSVQEGSRVKAGDPIVQLTDNDPEILERLETERAALNQRLSASRTSTSVARKNLDRQRELFKQGLAAKRTVEIAEIELARFLTDEANSSAELARLEVRLARQSNQTITAPRNGTILRRRTGESSDLVKAGDLIAVLVPETPQRSVELWIDGNDMPLIQEGSEARLQFEGWPAVQFSGWPSVAIGTFPGTVALVDSTDDGSGKFRILVTPKKGAAGTEKWPDSSYLRQGVRAHGWVLLNQVTLGYELWRRFNDFPPSLPGKPVKKGEPSKKEGESKDGDLLPNSGVFK